MARAPPVPHTPPSAGATLGGIFGGPLGGALGGKYGGPGGAALGQAWGAQHGAQLGHIIDKDGGRELTNFVRGADITTRDAARNIQNEAQRGVKNVQREIQNLAPKLPQIKF